MVLNGTFEAVAIPHYSLIANVIQITVSDIVKPGVPPENKKMIDGSIATGVLPFFRTTLFSRATIVVMAKFSLEDFLNNIIQYRITHLLVVPPIIVLLCKHPLVKKYDLSHVHFLNSGGAPLSPELIAPLSKVLPNAIIAQGYGMTETATAVTQTPITDRILKRGSVGHLLPGVKMRVVKADGTAAKPGEPGEMFVYSPSNALAYYGDEKATKETFLDGCADASSQGYLPGAHQKLAVRGFQVAPAELEGHLLDHPDVADACVVPVPDDFNGELPFAFIVLRPHAATLAVDPKAIAKLKKAIAKHVSDAKIKYKWLNGGIEFIDVVPKNASGKLLRRMLKDKAKAARKAELANAGPQAKL
ncbi:hypothetical protein EWM64_g170 [Hericium alpestre]|uniref:AMP-dependent synthetase/ligase domain-containing protein n=1 Tax=Hericium alpestre TaxID=135208 RepID=A0A4Z0AC09_9AGAM|nr:hypothetical protein EWM64_g170 [Hericium alpestre]